MSPYGVASDQDPEDNEVRYVLKENYGFAGALFLIHYENQISRSGRHPRAMLLTLNGANQSVPGTG